MSGDNFGEGTTLLNISPHQVNEKLAEFTLEGKWQLVLEIYRNFPEAHTATITNNVGTKSINEGTALHVAIELDEEQVVEELLNIIIEHEKEEPPAPQEQKMMKEKKPLESVNENGDTPLHVAASRGFAWLCKLIVGDNKERIYLVKMKNKEGETPLFQAALNWSKDAFAYLSTITRDSVQRDDLLRKNGDSILHCAIKREFFDLAVIIMHYYDFLSTHTNNDGFTPLKVLATRPSAFRSATRLSWWMLILYDGIFVEPLDVERTMKKLVGKIEKPRSGEMEFPMNYATLCEFPKLVNVFAAFGQHDTENPPTILEGGILPPNYATFQQFVGSAYVHALGLPGAALIEEIRKTKKKHQWSSQLLEALMRRPYSSFTGTGGSSFTGTGGDMPHGWNIDPDMYNILGQRDQGETSYSGDFQEERDSKKATKPDEAKNSELYETPFLLAARNGIVEMVTMILSKIPSAIHNTSAKEENVLLVAVINRQPLVVETLKMKIKPEVWNNLILAADDNENTVLHLAGYALSEKKPWQMAGSALQMMWDTKWYEYIRDMAPPDFISISNYDGDTAGEIFETSHKALVEQSSTWLKEMSESCSVVAVLVAGVSFATSGAVPGGTDDGRPILEGQPAFDAFAVSSLIGLCSSLIGLIMFLAILTSRKEAGDFRRGLPFRLLLGLSFLFVSIMAMFVSFCTGHFFIINQKYRRTLFLFYAATFLPVAFYAMAQFPLYFDLLTIIFTKVPRGRDKVHL